MKRIFTIILLALVVVGGFADSEDLEIYTYLYEGALTQAEQLALLQNVAELKISGAGEFYAGALNRLVTGYQNIRDVTEKSAADEQVLLLAELLGNEKYSAAASDLWRVVESFTDPLVKAEALMALGKMRAAAFLPQVVKVLADLNATSTPDRLYGERIALGAIIALEKYQDPSGYLPVYFAATGWYSERIKSQAQKTLAVISADPTDYMTQIITSSGYAYTVKLAALQSMEASGAAESAKAAVALAALSEGHRASTNVVAQRTALNQMRKLAIDMIKRYGTEAEEVCSLLERSYKQFAERNDGDRDEALNAITTLAALGTDESARRLSAFLTTINQKLQSGTLTRKDEDLVREIIPALGRTGRPIARPILRVVDALNWTPAVKALAAEALKNIP
jgi:cellobiose-specific phosphotransferase system component IIA